MSDETIEAALKYGIALGKLEKPARPTNDVTEEDFDTKLAVSFSAVAELTKGLEKLRDMKGSTFKFELKKYDMYDEQSDTGSIIDFKTNVLKDDNNGAVIASVNIPREDYNGSGGPGGMGPFAGTLEVFVSNDSKKNLEIPVTSPQAVEKALLMIAEQYQRKRSKKPTL